MTEKITKSEQKLVQQELEKIRRANGGTLLPKKVVDYARDPKTALHSRFVWDDSEAAEKYRLWQARDLIRVCVRIVPRPNGEPIETRVYVSIYQDRKSDDSGGYRTLTSVMNSKKRRAQFLAQALGEYRSLGEKYKTLTELAGIFREVALAERRAKK